MSKAPQYATLPTFLPKNIFDTVSNKVKFMPINAENDTVLHLQEEPFFTPKILSLAAMQLQQDDINKTFGSTCHYES